MSPTTTAGTPAGAVVAVHDLTMRFGRKLVHGHIDLQVRQGEILAIVGGSGSGKSTLLREMVLLQRPTSGSVQVLGREISQLGEAEILQVRRRIGVLFQNGALFGGLNVLENVGAPLREQTDLGDGLIDEIACVKLALVGLSPADGLLYPNQLSGGMRKRVALARAIALDPELLFLDEPTSGLDPLSADAFDELVLELKAALDPTIVVVTHDMDSLWRVADRVVLLGEGRLLAEGGDHARASALAEPRGGTILSRPAGACGTGFVMTGKTNYVLVRLFVLVLSVTFVAGVLWLAAGGSGRIYDEYLVYMRESVSGLSRDNAVKYHGVDVGRVHKISLDPARAEEVRLLLQIDRGTPIREDTVAVLETQGMTGLAYINLEGGSVDSPPLRVRPGERYPLIESRPSIWGRLDRGVEELVSSLTGVSRQFGVLLNEDNQRRLSRALDNLEQLSAALAGRVDFRRGR